MYTIIRNLDGISITHADKLDDTTSNLETIPGFDFDNISILYKALCSCQFPGLILNEFDKLQLKFSNLEKLEIDWIDWLNTNLFPYMDLDKNSKTIQNKLEILVLESFNSNPSLTDVFMITHINECCSIMGLDLKDFYSYR